MVYHAPRAADGAVPRRRQIASSAATARATGISTSSGRCAIASAGCAQPRQRADAGGPSPARGARAGEPRPAHHGRRRRPGPLRVRAARDLRGAVHAPARRALLDAAQIAHQAGRHQDRRQRLPAGRRQPRGRRRRLGDVTVRAVRLRVVGQHDVDRQPGHAVGRRRIHRDLLDHAVLGDLAVLAQHHVDAAVDAQERQRGRQPHGAVFDAALTAERPFDARDAQLRRHHLVRAGVDQVVDHRRGAGVDVRERDRQPDAARQHGLADDASADGARPAGQQQRAVNDGPERARLGADDMEAGRGEIDRARVQSSPPIEARDRDRFVVGHPGSDPARLDHVRTHFHCVTRSTSSSTAETPAPKFSAEMQRHRRHWCRVRRVGM